MSNSPDMSVAIGDLKMQNPVTVASGTFGYGPEYSELVDINQLGAITVKGICLNEKTGNFTPRSVETASGLINSIGLPGPGVKGFVENYMPFLREHTVPVIVNIWGTTLDEYGEVAARLSDVEGIHALEINVSCPNVKTGGSSFGTDPDMLAQVVREVRKNTTLPIIPKLAPNIPDVGNHAKVCESEGSDGISLINSLPAMAIDVETRKPILANKFGGLTGPAVHPVAVKQVFEASSAVSIPVIGMGGIVTADDAIEFMIAGATAVAVGTANFYKPDTVYEVINGIRDYLIRHNMASATELTGSLQLD